MSVYLIKVLALISIPGLAYFSGKKVPFFKKKPVYHSVVILLAFAIAGCIFWKLK